MRSFVALFAATSTAELSSLSYEPISMLLWGATLLTLGAFLSRRNSLGSADRSEISSSEQMGRVPSLAERS